MRCKSQVLPFTPAQEHRANHLIFLPVVQIFSGVIVLDGNRGRFALPDWKTMLVVKVLRTRLRELLTRAFKHPGKLPTAQHEKWLEVWQRLFTQDKQTDTKSSVTVAAAK